MNENIMEKANEVKDGAFETWCKEHQSDLIGDFINDYAEEYNDYCKQTWNEINE